MSDTRKLPVFASIGEVLSGVTRHYFQLLVVAWPALIFMALAVAAAVWQSPYPALMTGLEADATGNLAPALGAKIETMNPEQLAQLKGGFWRLGVAFFFFVLATTVGAVRWHRFALLGESGLVTPIRKEDGIYIWTLVKLVLVFFVGMFVCAMIMFVPTMAGKAVASEAAKYALLAVGLFGVVCFFWFYFVVIRLFLALPDAAVGRGGRVGAIYEASRGNGWRLFWFGILLSLLVQMIVTVAVLAVSFFVGLLHFEGTPYAIIVGAFLVVLIVAAYFYLLMTQITMLSVAYREIIGLPSAASAHSAAA